MIEGEPVPAAIILPAVVALEGEIYPLPAFRATGMDRGFLFFRKESRKELPDFFQDRHYRDGWKVIAD
jgi:hypothetical protein